MGAGSYARFVIGIILSLEIIRSFFSDKQVSSLAIGLAIVFIILTALFFVKRV